MSLTRRTGFAHRSLAVFLTAYCVLASGRALIPGLCATLADLDRQASVRSCCETPLTCCGGADLSRPHLTSEAAECPFCHLVHAAAQPIALVSISVPTLSTPLRVNTHDQYVPDSAPTDGFPPRAPPLS